MFTPEQAACLEKTAALLDSLVEVITEQNAELVDLRSKAAANSAPPVVLQKVASANVGDFEKLRGLLVTTGMSKEAAAGLCADFGRDPATMRSFLETLVRDYFVHAPADGHGIPKSASDSSSSTSPGSKPGPWE